jgi:hypothetical protein
MEILTTEISKVWEWKEVWTSQWLFNLRHNKKNIAIIKNRTKYVKYILRIKESNQTNKITEVFEAKSERVLLVSQLWMLRFDKFVVSLFYAMTRALTPGQRQGVTWPSVSVQYLQILAAP